jgi:hypothetical protein
MYTATTILTAISATANHPRLANALRRIDVPGIVITSVGVQPAFPQSGRPDTIESNWRRGKFVVCLGCSTVAPVLLLPFSAVTLMVMVTTFVAPPLLKLLLPPKKPAPSRPDGIAELVS